MTMTGRLVAMRISQPFGCGQYSALAIADHVLIRYPGRVQSS